jgi:AcrR family transcriptional regulator
VSSATRQRNPRGEGARLREPLIDAAVEVIGEVGDASKVSVRAITRRAGVSPTALYLHFPDRDAVVEAAVDRGFAAFNAALLEAAEVAATRRDRLRAMGLAYLAFAQEQPHLYFVIFSAARTFRDSGPVDRGAAFDALVETTADKDVAIALWAALHGYATLTQTVTKEDFPSPAAFVERLLDAYL